MALQVEAQLGSTGTKDARMERLLRQLSEQAVAQQVGGQEVLKRRVPLAKQQAE